MVSALFTSNTIRDFSFALLGSGREQSFFSAASFASSWCHDGNWLG